MQTLNADLKSGEFKRVYLLFGDEGFLKKSYKNRLKDKITGGDTMNYNYYEGKGLDVNEIIGLADFLKARPKSWLPIFLLCRRQPACCL